MKIAYCGYDFFSQCLQSLLSRGDGVYRVFTFDCDNRFDFNEYIATICEQHSLPFTSKPLDQNTLSELQQENCELIITAGYRYKLPDLSNTGIRGINIHPSLLPVGRGPWPLSWTIQTDQKFSGITIHKLTDELDAGDILLQESFPLEINENLESLSARTQILAKAMLPRVMENFNHYWNTALPQPEESVYWPRPGNNDRTLNWNSNISEIDRLSRAYGKMGCFATFDNNYWVVYRLITWKETHDFDTGSVVHKTNTEMIVAASDGLVSLQYFEPASTIQPGLDEQVN